MQELPLNDPRSWRYQAAIHGLANTPPPRGAPWNECQHLSWFFFPWHRMYLFHFERIVRSFVDAAGGPAEWTLPYWDYSSGAPGNALPPAFREARLPDGSNNPLFVSRRRTSINNGTPLPAAETSTSDAFDVHFFTNNDAALGFGGPRTGWAHQGPAPGVPEITPHGSVHVRVGGPNGLMTDPDLAALDPIFWLHHANLDRLWDAWRLSSPSHVNPTLASWLNRRFALRDSNGAVVRVQVRDVVDDIAQLDYTYDKLPASLAAPAEEEAVPVPRKKKPVTIARTDQTLTVLPSGASTALDVGPLPAPAAAAAGTPAPRVYLDLSDIEGEKNPGIVYGVYVNLPEDASEQDREDHRAGVVSFFGIEQAGKAGAAASGRQPHPLRYSFDITELVDRLRARGRWNEPEMKVELLPIEPDEEEETAAASAVEPIRVGAVSLHAG
jgi:hypothetical protein